MEFDFPKRRRVKRLSVSIPRHLSDWARATAIKYDVSISAVVETALSNMRNQEKSSELVKSILEDSFAEVEDKKITVK